VVIVVAQPGQVIQVKCQRCETEFIPVKASAKYCSGACRASAAKARAAGLPVSVQADPTLSDNVTDIRSQHPLVTAIREIVAGDDVPQAEAQMAVLLATNMISPQTGTNLAALTRQLSATLEKIYEAKPRRDQVEDIRLRVAMKRARLTAL